MRNFFLLLTSHLSLLTFVFSQQDSLVRIEKHEQKIELSANYFFNSNAITNDFLLAFYRGEYLDRNLKDDVSDLLKKKNRLGAELNSGFTYSNHFSGRTFSFSFFDRQHFDAQFSDDLFNTIFYGNKPFAGDTTHLGNFKMNLLRYQQFRFGWKWDGDAAHGSYGFAFSLLNGEQNLSINAPRANWFSNNDGTFNAANIDFSIAMKVRQSDTAQKKFFAQNGMGIAADFFYEMPYTVWSKHGKIFFEAMDFGFIRWNAKAMIRSVDSSYHYEGVQVNDILHISNNTFPKIKIDSILNKNSKFTREQYTTYLPSVFKIRTLTKYTNQFALEKGIIFFFNSSAVNYYYLKLHFGIAKNTTLSYIVGYGGYGKFHAGLEFKTEFAKKYSLLLASDYLFTGYLGKASLGQGAMVKLARRF